MTKWKNRRRSTKSDLRRKSQDRDHVINQMINGAVKKEAGGLLKRYAPATNVTENLKLTLPNPVAAKNVFKVSKKSCLPSFITVQDATVNSCNMIHILPPSFLLP